MTSTCWICQRSGELEQYVHIYIPLAGEVKDKVSKAGFFRNKLRQRKELFRIANFIL